MRTLFLILILLAPLPAAATVLAAARTLPAGTVISEDDLTMAESKRPGLNDPAQAVGKQTRITIYEGRPIQASLLQAPRLVTRNQIVRITFQRGPLQISTEGRTLSEGAAGDVIRVLNLESRNSIMAQVNPDGSLTVLQ